MTSAEPCRECGEAHCHTKYLGDVGSIMLARGVCFTCGYWLAVIDEIAIHPVVDGTCYAIANEDEPPYRFRGHGGRRFVLRSLADGSEATTTNLWLNGPIPERFRDRLPDTHAFASPS